MGKTLLSITKEKAKEKANQKSKPKTMSTNINQPQQE